jgi:hypothetical protein
LRITTVALFAYALLRVSDLGRVDIQEANASAVGKRKRVTIRNMIYNDAHCPLWK